VIDQAPSAGSRVARGTRVTIAVSTGPGSAPLPSVAGLSASRAKAKLEQAGYKPVLESQPSSGVASGHVVSTNPPAGTELQFGSQVTVIVSSGPAQIAVPDVVGESRAAAEAALTNARLTVGTVTRRESEQPADTVLGQTPAAGATLPSGGEVELTVAQAPQEVAVPDVRGAARAAASKALERAGLEVRETARKTTEQAQKGVVLGQSPAGGTRVRKGSTVTIEVGELVQTTTTDTTPNPPATPPPTPPAASG
jgi:serine/threonine-protein kinase